MFHDSVRLKCKKENIYPNKPILFFLNKCSKLLEKLRNLHYTGTARIAAL
jgi:hypothetical protein